MRDKSEKVTRGWISDFEAKKKDSLQGAETKTLPEHKVVHGLAQTGATSYQAKYRMLNLCQGQNMQFIRRKHLDSIVCYKVHKFTINKNAKMNQIKDIFKI